MPRSRGHFCKPVNPPYLNQIDYNRLFHLYKALAAFHSFDSFCLPPFHFSWWNRPVIPDHDVGTEARLSFSLFLCHLIIARECACCRCRTIKNSNLLYLLNLRDSLQLQKGSRLVSGLLLLSISSFCFPVVQSVHYVNIPLGRDHNLSNPS